MNTSTKISFPIKAILMAFVVLVESDLAEIDSLSKVRSGGSKESGGVVHGARSCGGKGKFIQWRDACKTTDSPCEFPADGKTHNKEFTFVSSQNREQLGIKIIAAINGSKPIVEEDHPLENSKVIEGIEQTIFFSDRVSEDNKGSRITAQVELYRVDDKIVEMCVECGFILV